VTLPAGHRAGEGLPSSRRHHRYVPRPIRRGVPHGCASRLFAASMAFALISGARHSLSPPLRARPLTTPQASRHATDRIVAPPCRAFDAGLRPGPFPDRAASLLPGLLAATRTGLPPAGDDELTNSKIHHGVTSRCHLPFCWAHRRSRVKRQAKPPSLNPSGLLPAPLQRTPIPQISNAFGQLRRMPTSAISGGSARVLLDLLPHSPRCCPSTLPRF
jgi:hypothetical protein